MNINEFATLNYKFVDIFKLVVTSWKDAIVDYKHSPLQIILNDLLIFRILSESLRQNSNAEF